MRKVEVKQKKSGLSSYILMTSLYVVHLLATNKIIEWVLGFEVHNSKLYLTGVVLATLGFMVIWAAVLYSKYERYFWLVYEVLIGITIVMTFILRFAVRENGFEELTFALICYTLLHAATLGADIAYNSIHTNVFD